MVGRSMLTQEFAVAGPFGDGPVAVTGFVHPERGPVDCPAAPLLAAWLWRVGGASAHRPDGPAAGAARRGASRQARRVEPVDAQAVAFVLRPGTSVRSAAETVAVLRGRFLSLRGQHPDQWCYRADDREEAVSRAVSLSDVALLLGAEVLPRPSAVRCHRLDSLVDLLPGHVRAASTVALIDGTPEGQGGRDLLRALRGLGPVSVLRLRAASERAGNAATVPEGRRGDGSGTGPVPAAMDTGTM